MHGQNQSGWEFAKQAGKVFASKSLKFGLYDIINR